MARMSKRTVSKLADEARELGRNGVLQDPTDYDVLCAAMDIVETPNRPLRFEDLPPGSGRWIIAAYDEGDAQWQRA